MNGNLPNVTENTLAKSLRRLRDGVPPNISFILIGSFAMVFNAWAIKCIGSTKSLRTKCFVLIGANASIDFLLGASYSAIAMTRLYRYYTGIGEVITMWRCCWEASLITLAQSLSLSMSLAIVVDRLAAMIAPHKYKSLSYKQITVPFVLFVILSAAAQSAVHFVDSWKNKGRLILTCGIEDTILDDHLHVLIIIQIITSMTVITLNCVLAFYVRKRRKKVHIEQMQQQITQTQAKEEKRELRIFKTITVITVTHMATHLGGRVILFLVSAATQDVHVQSMTSRYTRQLVVLNAAFHFFILFFTSSQFRSAVKAGLENMPLVQLIPGNAS